MALGGGTFVSENKKLPGSYINFISLASASSALSERGIAAMGLILDWGADGEIMTITKADLEKNSVKYFGYDFTHAKLKGIRDLFKNIHTLYAYKLNSATTGIAANTFATAIHSGIRGNDIKIVIAKNVDDATKWDVSTYFDNALVETQTVATAADLKANDFVTFKADAELAVTAGLSMTGGISAAATAANHQAFLTAVEPYSFNAIGAVSDERASGAPAVNALYASFCTRMRDTVGKKFQAVLFRYPGNHEGIVNVKNLVTDSGESAASLVYWVTGVIAGTAINASALNKLYDGEYTVDTNFTQSELETCLDNGEFTLHRVGADVRVLGDINSLVETTADKGDIFKENQTIRVIDCIANDIANVFNTKYLGKVPNDASGRISLWADIVKHHRELERIRAIENFDENAVTVEQGASKRSVRVNDAVTIVNAMAQLYMTCVID